MSDKLLWHDELTQKAKDVMRYGQADGFSEALIYGFLHYAFFLGHYHPPFYPKPVSIKWFYSEMVCQDYCECLRFLEQIDNEGYLDIQLINPPARYPGTVVVYSRVINKKEPEKVSE